MDPLQILHDSDSDLHASISGNRELAFGDGEISKKNKLLIALAIDISKRAENGIKSLALQAMAEGATKTEITETLRIAHFVCGAGAMYSAAAALKEVL